MGPKPQQINIAQNSNINDMPASASSNTKDIYDEIALWLVTTYEKQKRPVFYRNGVAHIIPYNTKINLFE